MNAIQRIKDKIVEEMEEMSLQNDDESNNNMDKNEVEKLQSEISYYKQLLQKNCTIYYKRLDKRKDKINILLGENNALKIENNKFKKSIDYEMRYNECRDQLEQLEGLQIQELAKVKHLLLNTEAELQLEKKERKKVEDEALTTQENKISSLSLETLNDSLESALQKEYNKVLSERDFYRNALLEIEIEKESLKNKRDKELTLEFAQLVTEKETLDITLDLRESENKKLKEELRKLKDDILESTTRGKDDEKKLSSLENQLRQQNQELENLLTKYNESLKENETQKNLLKKSQNDLKVIQGQWNEKNEAFDALNVDFEACLLELHGLSVSNSELEIKNREHLDKIQQLQDFIENIQTTLRENEAVSSRALENFELLNKFKNANKILIDDNEEKKIALKLSEQRLADIKKTLQRELAKSNFELDSKVKKSCPESDVNFQYLKHVILKFFTSREYEAKQLTRAIATLLHFTPDETQLLLETLTWKSSWFGVKPKQIPFSQI